MTLPIRPARESDAKQVAAIYAPIVRDTPISFEMEAPGTEEMAKRIRNIQARLPWLVCESEGKILGYAYATPHRQREAYQWSTEVSVYVHDGARRRSIGRALYTALFKILALMGYYNAYGGITLPNPPSVRLHESMGFERVGIYQKVGYKRGAWHDVGWWHLRLQEGEAPPEPAVPFEKIRESEACKAALSFGAKLLEV